MNLLHSQTSKRTLISLGTTGGNGVLGLLFYIFAARLLGPGDFGGLMVVLAILVVASDIGDFGLNSGIVNFVSRHRDEERYFSFIQSALFLKFIFGFIAVLIISVGASFIAETLFQKESLSGLLISGSVGILGQMLFSTATSIFQALQRFYSWSVLLIGSNLARLLALYFLVITKQLTVENVLFSFILMPVCFFLLALLLLPTKKIFRFEHSLVTFELLSFSSWVGLTNVFWVVLQKIDTLLLARLVTSVQLGVYGIAAQLTVVVNQLISAFAVVLGPKFAQFEDKKSMHTFLLKSIAAISGVVITILVILPLLYFLLPLLLGDGYRESVPVLMILILGGMALLLATPIHESIRYYFQRPELFLTIYGLQLIVTAFFGYYLAVHYSLVGMAFGILAGSLLNLIVSFYFYFRLLSQKEN